MRRRLMKFLHTMGATGLMGAMAALVVMLGVAPPPSALDGYAATRSAMGAVATWIVLPSLALIDPSLAVSAPPSVTAATGLDALVSPGDIVLRNDRVVAVIDAIDHPHYVAPTGGNLLDLAADGLHARLDAALLALALDDGVRGVHDLVVNTFARNDVHRRTAG